MKKTWVLYSVFGLIFYLLFLLATMPAGWFAWGLDRFTDHAVRLDPLEGSLWSGKGKLVVYYPQNVPNDFGDIEWRINPFWLFAGKIQLSCQAGAADGGSHATLRLGYKQIQFLNTDTKISAKSISTFYPAAGMISPQGQINLRTDKLTISREGADGTAILLWQDAGSALSPVKPLGDYRVELTGAGKSARLQLTTLRGALDLSGEGQWQIESGQVQLTGSANPRERAAELEPLLKFIGNDIGNGKRTMKIDALLPAIKLSAANASSQKKN